ncbi:MAG: hypothetical protein PHV61_10435, partial [Limnochordia bacterium]|nr:hypothetical protein [Limnochordia bacterium]
FPADGFATIEDSREWVRGFVDLYNNELLHSGIKFVTPYQRHYDLDIKILSKRDAVYQAARERHPERWTGKTRNWKWIDEVTLNPVTEQTSEKEKEQIRDPGTLLAAQTVTVFNWSCTPSVTST